MRRLQKRAPRTDELWLSRPPYLLVARILDVDWTPQGGVVSYELHDEQGSLLEHVSHAALDEGWWRAFQPLTRRWG